MLLAVMVTLLVPVLTTRQYRLGGQSNPRKVGGSIYSEYQMTTDPAVKTRDWASALLEKTSKTFNEAGKHLAGSTDRSIETGIKYPGQN